MDPFDSIKYESEYLLRFSSDIRTGAAMRDPESIREGIEHLESWLWGIKRTLDRKVDAEVSLKAGWFPLPEAA